jgi:hypothetical protein
VYVLALSQPFPVAERSSLCLRSSFPPNNVRGSVGNWRTAYISGNFRYSRLLNTTASAAIKRLAPLPPLLTRGDGARRGRFRAIRRPEDLLTALGARRKTETRRAHHCEAWTGVAEETALTQTTHSDARVI